MNTIPEPFVFTPQTQLVRLQRAHLKQWLKWFRDENLLYWISCPRKLQTSESPFSKFSRTYIREKFEKAQRGFGFAIETREKEHIGNLIVDENQEFSLEFGVFHYWGRGLGSEVLAGFFPQYDRWVGGDLILWVFDFNLRAIRLYQKFGFIATGKVEQGFYQGGKKPCSHLQFLRRSSITNLKKLH